ncbi:hypothetical protein LSTR_LSTR001301, partial [Laodelphax striatellus]
PTNLPSLQLLSTIDFKSIVKWNNSSLLTRTNLMKMDSNKDKNSSDIDLRETFQKRFLHLLNNDIDCDCEFVFGSQNIIVKGHKFLFSAASEVFHAMFHGELKEENAVRIEDLDPEGFQGMRQFIYTGEVNFKSAVNALLTYIAARKYIIPALTRECIDYLGKKHNIQPSEVLEFYEICKANNIPEFEESCYEIIQQQTDEVVSSECFLSIKPETMELILKSPNLKLNSEVDVLQHFEKWVTAEAERRGIDVREMMASSIHNLMKHIRFLTISSDDFVSNASDSLLLTPEEKLAVVCNLIKSESKPMPKSLSLERKHRNFVSSSISESEIFNYKHTFVVSLDDCVRSSEYLLRLKLDFFSPFIITFTKIYEYLCFQVEIDTKIINDDIDLLTMTSKFKAIPFSREKSDHLLSENELNIIVDWNTKQHFEMVLAKIPISKLRNVDSLISEANTVTIHGLFNVTLEESGNMKSVL